MQSAVAPGRPRRRIITLRVNLSGNVECVGGGQIGVGRGHGQNQTRLLRDELHQHVLDLGLDVRRLIAYRNLGHARKIDESDVQH